MSAVALTAEALERGLRDRGGRSRGTLAGVSAGLQRAVAKANAGAWIVATGDNLRWPGTEGGSTSAGDRLVHRYLDRVVAAATVDPVVAEAFFDVVALLAAPTSLLRPALALRVLARRHALPAPTPPAPLPAATPARAA
jgi:hypothetical protein